jgi:hypothetical protein
MKKTGLVLMLLIFVLQIDQRTLASCVPTFIKLVDRSSCGNITTFPNELTKYNTWRITFGSNPSFDKDTEG